MQSTLYSWPILMKLVFYGQIFETPQISNFMKIRPVGPSCSMWTDTHDEANSPLSKFSERTLKNCRFSHFASTKLCKYSRSS